MINRDGGVTRFQGFYIMVFLNENCIPYYRPWSGNAVYVDLCLSVICRPPWANVFGSYRVYYADNSLFITTVLEFLTCFRCADTFSPKGDSRRRSIHFLSTPQKTNTLYRLSLIKRSDDIIHRSSRVSHRISEKILIAGFTTVMNQRLQAPWRKLRQTTFFWQSRSC